MSTRMNVIYLTVREVDAIADRLENVKVVNISALYERDDRISSTALARYILEHSDEVESALFVATDLDEAYLRTKVDVSNAVEYITKKVSENKVVAVYDGYETDYVIFK